MEQVTRNRELFFAVADRAQFDPNSYDQLRWVTPNTQSECGTTACIAGNALLLSGWHNDGIYGVFRKDRRVVRLADQVKAEARELLGLSEVEADYLFYGSWRPRRGLSVPDALRLVGKGESVVRVSREPLPPTHDEYNEELTTVYVFLLAEDKERERAA